MHASEHVDGAMMLGEVVAAAYEVGSQVTPDPVVAAKLAARRLERVLVRGANRRLQSALSELARELEPAARRVSRSRARRAAAAH